MSMSEPFTPATNDVESAPAAAEPGPGAPGVPVDEEPDVLPGSEPADDELSLNAAARSDTPFRTPTPGDSLTADELEDRI
jgi:hypothetical protein